MALGLAGAGLGLSVGAGLLYKRSGVLLSPLFCKRAHPVLRGAATKGKVHEQVQPVLKD